MAQPNATDDEDRTTVDSGSCYMCATAFAGHSTMAVVEHYTREHPDHELTARALADLEHSRECAGCGASFTAALSPGSPHDRRLVVEAYCDECTAANPLHGLLVEEIFTDSAIRAASAAE